MYIKLLLLIEQQFLLEMERRGDRYAKGRNLCCGLYIKKVTSTAPTRLAVGLGPEAALPLILQGFAPKSRVPPISNIPETRRQVVYSVVRYSVVADIKLWSICCYLQEACSLHYIFNRCSAVMSTPFRKFFCLLAIRKPGSIRFIGPNAC